jgi:hypothetical protein
MDRFSTPGKFMEFMLQGPAVKTKAAMQVLFTVLPHSMKKAFVIRELRAKLSEIDLKII